MSNINKLVIVATIEGVKAVVSEISSIGDAAARTEGRASLLGKALGALGSAGVLAGFVKYSNEFTNLENKLKVVTSGTEELTNVTNKLYDIAQNTRTAYSDTAKLYQRVALAGQQLGNTQETNLRVTDLLNKSIIISGASSIEASNAMIQLSQGLAKGTLNGDELRSVLEQLPYVADLIAKHMGVARGELRQLGADGKITAQIVQESILGAGDSIDQTFSKMDMTIGQALTNVDSAFTKVIGEFNKVTGLSTGLAHAIDLVAKNMAVLMGAAGSLAAAFAVFKAAELVAWLSQLKNVVIGLNQVQVAGVGMSVTMTRLQLGLKIVGQAFMLAATEARAFALSNPFTAIAMALTVLLPLMYAYGDSIKLSSDGTVTFKSVVDELFGGIQQGLVPIMGTLGDSLQAVLGVFNTLLQVLGTLLLPFTTLGQKLVDVGQNGVSLGQIVNALAEGLAYMGRVLVALVIAPYRALAEVMGSLGLIAPEALDHIRAQTDGVLNLAQAARDAQQRMADYANGTSQATSASASAASQAAATSGAYGNLANASRNAGAAIKEKASYLLEEDIAYTKIAGGITTYVTNLTGLGTTLSGTKEAQSGLGQAIRMSADGINAITASEAYYAEQSKASAQHTDNLKGSVSTLDQKAVSPATTAMTSLGTSTAKAAGGLKDASTAATSLKESVAGSISGLNSQVTAMNNAATAARNLAAAYREAAAAAAALAAAKSASGSGGSQVQHNGGLVNSQAPIRYHTGGIVGTPMGPDEISAILQKGEEVLTRDDPRHVLNRGTAFGWQQGTGQWGTSANEYLTITRGMGSGANGVMDRLQWWTPLETITRNLQKAADATGQDQTLPDAQTSYVSSYGNLKAFTAAIQSFNAFDPFGQRIAQIQTGNQVSQMLGGGPQMDLGVGLNSLSNLQRLQGIFMDSLKADWVSKNDLENVLTAQQRSGSGSRDYQTLTQFDQGYKGQGPSTWQPDLVATKNAQGAGASGDINVNVELKAQDMTSFRQNAATVDSMMYAAVERAKRRINR